MNDLFFIVVSGRTGVEVVGDLAEAKRRARAVPKNERPVSVRRNGIAGPIAYSITQRTLPVPGLTSAEAVDAERMRQEWEAKQPERDDDERIVRAFFDARRR